MPLQKPPPNGASLIDSYPINRHQLRGRRQTLQTVRELDLAGGASPSLDSFITTNYYAQTGLAEAQNGAKKDQPSLDKMLTLSFEGLRAQPYAPPTTSTRQRSKSVHGVDSMTRPNRYEQGWNVRRAQARMQHGQAVANAPSRREPSHHTMHATRALPLAKPQEVQTRNHSVQRHLPRNRHSMSNPPRPLERRSSFDGTARHADPYNLDAQSQKQAITKPSSYHPGHNRAVRRSRSDPLDQSPTSQTSSHMQTASSAPTQFYHLNATLHHHKGNSVDQPAKSINQKDVSTLRTSSLPTHNTTIGANPCQLSLRSKPQRHYSQVQRVDMEFLTSLTASSYGPSSEHHRSPPTVTFANVPRVIPTPPHSHRPRRHTSSQNRTRSRSNLSVSHHTNLRSQRNRAMSVGMAMTMDKHNFDNRAPAPLPLKQRAMPSRESLTKWNSEREAVNMSPEEKHRALIRERVRRANELEEQKEKELLMITERGLEEEKEREREKEKEKEKEKKKEKEGGCLGGLFRTLWRGTA